MTAYDSADARTALMASYFSRYPHPQAGMKPITSHSPLQRRNVNVPDGVKSPKPATKGHDAPLSLDRGLAMRVRGRTIYNANLVPSGVDTDTRSDSTRSGWLERMGQMSSLTALEQLEKIDAEETKRKELFTRCSACSGRYLTQEGVLFWNDDDPTTGSQVREGDDTAVREMFDMYIRVDECMG